ncbi:MAG: hypothetical protein HKN99_01325 [Winogradskyella sp.]|nr:hypothetical protein [Winogradskyella sp.]
MKKDPKTDREILVKGFKLMGYCLLTMFLGPILLYLAFSNKTQSFYIPLLILAIAICFLAIFLLFKGIKTITDSFFQ